MNHRNRSFKNFVSLIGGLIYGTIGYTCKILADKILPLASANGQ